MSSLESTTTNSIVNNNNNNNNIELENSKKIEIKLREKRQQQQQQNSPVESIRPLGIIIDTDLNLNEEDNNIEQQQQQQQKPNIEAYQSSDSICEQQPQQEDYNIDPALYFHNRNPTLESFRNGNGDNDNKKINKSDSLDSQQQQQQACCTKLAFNFYNKALDSAKKHLPNRNRQKNRYSGGFPRSFGEDFHSLGPDGFYYLDNDQQTECSLDYRDLEFNRDSFLSFTGSEVIPELSEEEFFENKIQRKSLNQQQNPTNIDCTVRNFQQLPTVQGGEQTLAPIIGIMDENEPMSSTTTDQSIIKQRKGPSLFDRLFRRKDDNKKSRKARSESRERERRTKNIRATSLPPSTTNIGKHQSQHPVMKLGPDGQLWFEQQDGTQIISTTSTAAIDPNEAILSNVTRQSPIKLVYARPPEIIVQEVTNLTDTIDTLPRIQSPNVSSKPNQDKSFQQVSTDHRTPSPPNTVDEVAEKTMLDILDDAIRQLRDESSNQISPIYVNENIQPESSPTDQNKMGKQDKKSTKSTSPKFGRKKRKLPGYSSSPMAKFKDIRMTKPKFFRKFHSKNPKKMKETSQPTVELKDSKRNSDVDPTQVVAEANVPEITIDEVTPSSSNIQDDDDMNNVEIVDIEQKVEEPQPPPFLLSSNDKPKKKLVRKSKINLKSVRIPRSFRKISKKDDNHDDGFSKKISPPKSPQPSTTDLKEKLKNPFNRQNKQKQQQKHHFIRQLPRLPDIPESRNSTLNSQQHLYEGIKGSPQLNQRPYHNNSLEIEFPVGIPLDQPYEEFDDNNNEPGLSPFHRYPDQQQQDDNRNKESPIILQSELPVNNLSKLPVTEITLAKLPDSPVFDMKIPKEICERFPSSYHNQPPEILVKIPENHKFKTESLDKQSVNSDHQKQQSEFSFSNSNVPDIVMMEPEFILSKRPGIEIHHHDHSPLSSDMPSILTMEIKSDDNLEPSPSSSIYVPYNPPTSTTFDSNIESNRSTTRHQMAALNDAMHEKVDKIKNMAGSFRLKMKDFIHHTKTPSSKTDPKIIDQTLKPEFKFQETDLDQPTTATTDFDASMKIEQNQQQQQQQEKEKEIPMDYEDPSKIIEALDNLLAESGYRLDNDDNNMEKRSKKSFKKKFPKFEFTHKPRTIEQQQWTDNVNNNHHDDNDDHNDIERPTSFARKNRERFDQIRNRAQKSFGQFADRVKQQTQQIGERTRASITRAKTKSPLRKRPDRPPPPTSSFYDLHFASDSELSPGTGIDSLRRSTTTKVYQDLADQQERLEVYMQPVNRNQPRRPPRRHLNYDDDERRQQQHPDYMQSLPSLSVTKPKPPRPPPPNRYLTTSCQSMIPCDEEISLGTSTSSLLSSPQDKHRRRRRFPRRQRCPPEQFYKNVRLNYRPKKSYVELLQKSQPFYTMAIQQKSLERSQSTGQLYGRYKPKPIDNFGYPIPPLRRSRTLRSKPPICPPSRTIFDNSRAASVFSARSGGHGQNYSVPRDYLFINDQYRDNNNDDDQYLLKGKDFYSPYLQAPPITLNVGSQPDLQWSPFQWKVKRCRSFGETMDKQKLQSPELEETSSTTQTPDSNDTIVPSKSTTLKRSATTIVANQNYRIDNTTHRIIQPETVQQRMFKWLQSTSTTSLDTLRHRIPKNLNIIKQQQKFDSDNNKGLIRSRSNSKGRRQTPPPRPPPSSKMIMMMMMNRATSPSSSLSTTTTNQSISCYSTNNDYTNNNYYNYNNIDNFLADTFGDDIIGSTNNTLNGGDHLHKNHLPLSSSNRPLPPPPIPPRPKLIPAHYLYDVQRKQQQQRPLTRDVACDTSENGFEKFCQKNNNHGFLNNNRQQIEKLRRNDKDPDDDDITLVENNSSHRFYLHNQNGHHIPNGSINLDTIASVYTDARTHQSNNTLNSNHQNQNQKSSSIKQWFDDNNVSDLDDDNTINDDISSLSSSQYQSVMDHLSNMDNNEYLNQPEQQPAPIIKNNSFLHRYDDNDFKSSTVIIPQKTTATTTTTTESNISTTNANNIDNTSTISTTIDEYKSAAMDNQQPEKLQSFSTSADFQQQYSSLSSLSSSSQRSSMHSDHQQQQSEQQHYFDIDNDNVRNRINDDDYEKLQKQFDGLQMIDRMLRNNNNDNAGDPTTTTTIQIGGTDNKDVIGITDSTNNNDDDDLSKDNKNRQSFISTESTESTSSNESTTTTFSYSIESNKCISIPKSNDNMDGNVDGGGGGGQDQSTTDSSAALPTTSTEKSLSKQLSSESLSSGRKAKKSKQKKYSSSLREQPNEITRPLLNATTILTDATGHANGQILSNPSLRENLSSLPKSTPNGNKPDKRYYCVHELYTTERDYVDVLIMLTEEFPKAIETHVTPKWLSTFFRPLNQVTPINKHLLKELKQRILIDWDDEPKISDIIIRICPYLKEYSIYIREFDRINFMLDDQIQSNFDFEQSLRLFENNDRCRKLSIKSYLLKPIQRLPQYNLMLKQYAKLLDPVVDHDEYEGTQEAIRIVSEVVEHMEHESRMQEQSLTLNELRNRIILTKPTKIIIPGRELIRRGYLDKVSRKEVHVRHFILFNDVLFYLTPVMNGMYKLKEELPLLGMQVEVTQNLPCEFIVRSVKRSFALFAHDEKEREEWVRDLRKAIADHTEKHLSFKNRNSVSEMLNSQHNSMELINQSITSSSPQSTLSKPSNDQRLSILSIGESDYDYPVASTSTSAIEISSKPRLGDLAPVWLHDNYVTMCHLCTEPFTILNRRHHCRACGQIFCANCSSHQFPLKYLEYKPDRVCDFCYEELKSMQNPLLSSPPRINSMFVNHQQQTDVNSDYHDYANIESTSTTTPQISIVSISPQNSIKSNSSNSTTSTSGISSGGNSNGGILKNLTRKNRSNSCHELRNNQIKITANQLSSTSTLSHQSSTLLIGGGGVNNNNNNNHPHLQQQLLLRNNNIRLSSRLLKNKNVSSVLVEVKANDTNALISGWLQRYAQKKGWKRYWFVIKNMVLYTFKASEDVRALESLPLPSYDVTVSNESIKGYSAKSIIKLSHRCQPTIYFYVEQKELFKRWFECFKQSTLLQPPPPSSPLSTMTSSSSTSLETSRRPESG